MYCACICLCVDVCMHMRMPSEVQRVWGPLEGEWQAGVTHPTWVLEPSSRAVRANHHVSSPGGVFKSISLLYYVTGLSVCPHYPMRSLAIHFVPNAGIQSWCYFCPLSKSMKSCLDSSQQVLLSRAVSISLTHSVRRDSVCQPCLSKQTDMWLNVVVSGCVMWSQII